MKFPTPIRSVKRSASSELRSNGATKQLFRAKLKIDAANFRPHTTDEGFSLLTEFGDDGKILAGGQSLMP